MKKTLLSFVLAGAFFALVLSCATGPKVTAYDSSVANWGWSVDNDAGNGGSSTIDLTEETQEGMKAYAFAGNITNEYEYGFVNVQITPEDEATLDLLKTATAFSFRVLGDGERYAVKITTSDVEDYCYFETVFDTVDGEATTVIIPMGYLVQPSWGVQKASFKQDLAKFIEFQTTRNGAPGPFEFKLWDLKLYSGGIPTENTKASKAKASAPAAAKAVGGDLGAMSFRLADNFQYGDGYQGVFSDKRLMNGHKIVPGETYTLKITYSTSRDLEDDMFVGLCDTTPAAQYWGPLSWVEDETEMEAIPATKAGESVTAEITFTTTRGATAATGVANALVFQTSGEGRKGQSGSGVKGAITLNITEFVFAKVD